MSEETGVAAVERALTILDAMTDDRITLAELSKRTELYKSTLLRLLKSLERFGYVIRADDGTYRLGSKVLFLGSLYQRHFKLSDVVPPVLDGLVEELREGASFSVPDGGHRVVLHCQAAARSVRDAVVEGERLPLSHGAAGVVLKAFGGGKGERYDEVRDRMFAASFGEWDPELAAFACPVFGPGNQLVGALAISGPIYRIEALGEAKVVPALFTHAQALTRTLGGNPDAPEFAGWTRRTRKAAPVRAPAKAPKPVRAR